MQGHAGANVVPLVASDCMGEEVIETENGTSETTFYRNSLITDVQAHSFLLVVTILCSVLFEYGVDFPSYLYLSFVDPTREIVASADDNTKRFLLLHLIWKKQAQEM